MVGSLIRSSLLTRKAIAKNRHKIWLKQKILKILLTKNNQCLVRLSEGLQEESQLLRCLRKKLNHSFRRVFRLSLAAVAKSSRAILRLVVLWAAWPVVKIQLNWSRISSNPFYLALKTLSNWLRISFNHLLLVKTIPLIWSRISSNQPLQVLKVQLISSKIRCKPQFLALKTQLIWLRISSNLFSLVVKILLICSRIR